MAGQKKEVGAGKGDKRRPSQISEKELEEKWNRIFKKKDSPSYYAYQAPQGTMKTVAENDDYLYQEDEFGNSLLMNKNAINKINFGGEKG